MNCTSTGRQSTRCAEQDKYGPFAAAAPSEFQEKESTNQGEHPKITRPVEVEVFDHLSGKYQYPK